ncbi:MAG: hypothetical protein L3J41_05600 [Melioribacteraceae bacterium]|nr:hypothetical protein [Melioribacteraceae bacterium]
MLIVKNEKVMIKIITKILSFTVLFLFLSSSLFAQDSSKVRSSSVDNNKNRKFIDKDGDGYNDNAPDHDGDGIPNGLDPDYLKLKKRKHIEYVDADGDGINDNLLFNGKYQNKMKFRKKMNLKPQDGSNYKGGKGKQKGKGKGRGGG